MIHLNMVPIKTYKLTSFMQFNKIEMTDYIVMKKKSLKGTKYTLTSIFRF